MVDIVRQKERFVCFLSVWVEGFPLFKFRFKKGGKRKVLIVSSNIFLEEPPF